MAAPKVLVMSGYGINCEEETKFAFERAGASGDIVHINDLIDGHKNLDDYQILAFPGGFSFGDDTGSGKAFANKVRNNMWEELLKFVNGDKLVLGVCNGFQILTSLGLLPATDGKYGTPQVALVHNETPRYQTRWVDLAFTGKSPWVEGLGTLSLPIAHGEGNFFAEKDVLEELKRKGLIAAKYFAGPICIYQSLPGNPNGSLEDIAGITDESGRILGMMPHPERAIDFTHLPNWTFLKEKLRREEKEIPREGPGLQLFRNAARYFK